MIKKISMEQNPQSLEQDLKRYVQLALEHGASAATVIPAENIFLDERVQMKCRFPLCEVYGACMNCPPHTGTVDEMRARVKLFKFAVVFKVDFPSEQVISGKEPNEDRHKIGNILSRVESAAFYDGYYFATGFGAGSCRWRMCNNQPCQALLGQGCRHKARAYASMESVGMDVFRLAASLGWDIYPIGKSAQAEEIPHGIRLGLILIA